MGEAGLVELAGFLQLRARGDEVGVPVDGEGRLVRRQQLALEGLDLSPHGAHGRGGPCRGSESERQRSTVSPADRADPR